MARIDQDLLRRIMGRLKVGKARAYAIITETVSRTNLPPNIAAIVVARDSGISVARFASDEDWALIRGAASRQSNGSVTPDAGTPSSTPVIPSRKTRANVARNRRPKGSKVWVVYGRNETVRKSLFAFLRAVGLQPIEWNSALAATRKGSPHIAEVLDSGFGTTVATVVLLTPDDEAKLKDTLARRNELRFERRLTGQPRPNVLFEAGMAFGMHPDKTVLVQVGKIRPISDLTGRHIVHLSGTAESRRQLVIKLKAIGCPVDDSGDDWQTEGSFGK